QYQNYANVSEDSLKALVTNGLLDGYIKIEDNNVSELKSLNYISNGSGGIDFLSNLETDLNQAIRSERLSRAEVSDTVQQIYESSLDLNNQTISEKGTLEEANTGFLSVIGLFMGMIILVPLPDMEVCSPAASLKKRPTESSKLSLLQSNR